MYLICIEIIIGNEVLPIFDLNNIIMKTTLGPVV